MSLWRRALRAWILVAVSIWLVFLAGGFLLVFQFGLSHLAFGGNDFGPALGAAQQAAMIQSGAQGFIDKLQAYGEERARRLVYSIVEPKYLNPIVGVGYIAYHRELQFSPMPGYSFDLTPDRASVSATWHF